jgi:hypothetical protein
MHCERFETRLNEVLDARRPISSASDVEEHLRQCERCRDLARAYEAALVGLRQAHIPPAPAWLSRRVAHEVRRPQVIRFPRRRATLVAAAAAVLLAVAGLPWLVANRGRQATPERNTAAVSNNHPPQNVVVEQPGKQTNEDASAEGVLAMGSPADFLGSSGLKADGLMNTLPSTTWAHDVADGLEPVTKPTVGAISGFLQLWGVGSEGHRS